jgi:hypothetical protein
MNTETKAWCTPHPGDPGGPVACTYEPGHCVANVRLGRRPTRQDMLDFVMNGRRTSLTNATCYTWPQYEIDAGTCLPDPHTLSYLPDRCTPA